MRSVMADAEIKGSDRTTRKPLGWGGEGGGVSALHPRPRPRRVQTRLSKAFNRHSTRTHSLTEVCKQKKIPAFNYSTTRLAPYFLIFLNNRIDQLVLVKGWDLGEWLERLTVTVKVATVLGSNPAASSDTGKSEGWQNKVLSKYPPKLPSLTVERL